MPDLIETEIPWVGGIPDSWSVSPLFSVAAENKIKNEEGCENVLSLSYGRIVRRDLSKNFGLMPENFLGYQVVDKGYIIIRSTDLQNDKKSLRVGIAPEFGVITSAYIGLVPNPTVLPSFLFYYLNMCDLRKVFYSLGGGLRQSLRYEEFKRFPVVTPPITEQKLIARYLDKKTEQIDRLVEKIQKKIDLLKEQRTSLINHYVTKGLDPNVEMKDSGVEWIGEIPKHWDIISLRFCAEMLRGKFSHRPRNDPDFYDGDYPFIQTGDISKSKKYLTSYSQTLNEKGYSVSKEFPVNTLVMGIAANIGNVSILKIKSCFPDSIVGFYPKSNWKIDFLYFLFSSMTDEFIRNSIVSTQLNLNIDRIGDIRIPLVPLKEQEDICSFLDKSEDRHDHLLELYDKKIQKLHEYRQSLISSAVTGKIRITEDMI